MVPGNGLLDESLVVGFAAADLFDLDDLRKTEVSVDDLWGPLGSASGDAWCWCMGI
jgi:hypothetical protein